MDQDQTRHMVLILSFLLLILKQFPFPERTVSCGFLEITLCMHKQLCIFFFCTNRLAYYTLDSFFHLIFLGDLLISIPTQLPNFLGLPKSRYQHGIGYKRDLVGKRPVREKRGSWRCGQMMRN